MLGRKHILLTLGNIGRNERVQRGVSRNVMFELGNSATVKGPILRGLASRAPYFHNGSAATLLDAVDFYDQRFGIGFTKQQKTDLVNFPNAL
jgi:cytochrome c peroxidase